MEAGGIRMKFYKDHITWGKYTNKITGETEYSYYFCFLPNWLPKNLRYWGYHCMQYDGYHGSFGFWFFNISWSTQWTDIK